MERSHDKDMRNIQEPVNLASFQFVDFARAHFQGGKDMCQFSRAPLQSPLLNIQDQEDQKASSAIFIAILRFMSDMSDAKEPDVSEEGNQLEEDGRRPVKDRKRPYSSGSTFTRRIVNEKAQMASLTSDDVAPIDMMNRPTTNMEKIQFITSYGIRRRSLRDEIYCQICRQLTNNVSKTSYTRGWILLALCAGVFSPSDELLNFVRNFMKQGPKGYGEYCYNILQRTLENECRRQPPTIVELEAVKKQSPIDVNVTFMDKVTKSFAIDPATTCQELCQAIKERIGMKNMFGFSIFIAALDQVANWGCGNESVLDAVSLAEQYAITKGQYSRGAWQLFLRKDLMEPSLRPSDDKVATDLIYHQILGGVREEEYICNKNNDLVSLVAKRYYIEYGPNLEDGTLWEVVEATMPPYVLQHIEQNKFFDKVKDSFRKNSFVSEGLHPQKVKEDIVRYAAVHWPREFSRIFDALVVSGPRLPRIAVKLAVSSKGFVVVPYSDAEAARLLELAYSEINQVSSLRKGMYLDPMLVVGTRSSNSYTFRTVHADGLSTLLNSMLSLFSNVGTNDAREA